MDPLDRLRTQLERASCTVCGGALASGSMRVLAERDDLAFVELPCTSCGAVTLGMISLPDGSGIPGGVAADLLLANGLHPSDIPPLPDAAVIDEDDVLEMRRFLAGWHGGLRDLLARPLPGDQGVEGLDR